MIGRGGGAAGRPAGRALRRRAGGSPPRPGRDLRRALDLLDRDLDQLTEQARRLRRPVQGAGRRAVDAGRRARAADRRPAAARPGRGPRPRRVAGRGAARARRRRAPPAARAPPCCSSSTSRRCRPCSPGRCRRRAACSAYRPVEDADGARPRCAAVVEAAGVPVVVHCCAPDVPLRAAPRRPAPPRSRSTSTWSPSSTRSARRSTPGSACSPGWRPRPASRPPASADLADRVRQVWERLGFPADRLAAQVVVTPTCGLAGATPEYARAVLAACREAGQRLREE